MDILAAIMADPGVSPDLKRVLGAQPVDPSLQARIDAYELALGRMDWAYEGTDDHSAWRRGNAELCRLRAERVEIDPNGVLWDKYAPDGYRFSRVLA